MGLFDAFTGGGGRRAAAAEAAQATLPFSGEVAGIGGVEFDADERTFEVTQAAEQQETAGLLQQAVLQALQGTAGQQAVGVGQELLQQAGGFDLEQVAANRFNQLQALQEQGRAERQAALEQRLFRQGRLDSTGGARQLQAQAEAEERVGAQTAIQSRDQALAERQGLLSSALGAIQAGTGVTAQGIGTGLAAAGGRQQALTAPLAVGQFGITAGSTAGQGQLAAAQQQAQLATDEGAFFSGLVNTGLGAAFGG